MSRVDLHGWVDEQLSSVLNFPVPEDLIRYILAIENVRDLEDYLKTLLDFNNSQHRRFFSELLEQRQLAMNANVLDAHGYKKPPKEQDFVMPKHEKKKKSKILTEENVVFQNPAEETIQTKRKQKYVNLYSQEGQEKDVILLKGRHACECQASKHRLINNCLKCGRIVCEQEGSGPCLFCNALVCSPEEQEVLNSKTKKAEKLYQKLVDVKDPQNREKALQQRDRLLEYDRTSERRTRVIDDESDYFAANSVWLTKAEREKLQEKEAESRAKRHASQRNKKITLDFAGRQVIEERGDSDVYENIDEYLQNSSVNTSANMDDRSEFPDILSSLSLFQESSFSLDEDTLKNHMSGLTPDRNCYRIQDREFLEMSDEGFCLSMHQPWASLLVHGIKVHEGRTWYTPHRGRLWIAAGSKVPNPQDITEFENVYRILLADENIKFPTSYPVGCLLGCVNVVDCLPQEEYREKFPDGESDSPFVFICREPKELPIKFPIQGKHKIYKLDPKIHEAAKNLLMRSARQKAQEKFSHEL
ncbi:activating signal cointegrator 1 [Bacillus rossius redtenbacheri]|uniref:activating signal cointegrator 1 n=1 Tax=Bacillus rossius redtenbacheri TaxID=93214 RepID=UPI002FDD6A54